MNRVLNYNALVELYLDVINNYKDKSAHITSVLNGAVDIQLENVLKVEKVLLSFYSHDYSLFDIQQSLLYCIDKFGLDIPNGCVIKSAIINNMPNRVYLRDL